MDCTVKIVRLIELDYVDSNRRIVSLDDLYRKESYEFFSKFQKSYYGIGTTLCIDGVLHYKKKYGVSFYCIMSYALLKACNKVINFRYRREGEIIYLYDNIACSCTILNKDKNIEFTNCIYYDEDIKRYQIEFEKKKQEAYEGKKQSDLKNKLNLIYISAMPWFNIRYMDNVRADTRDDTIPRFTYGKYFVLNGSYYLDLSMEMSHLFVDGYHVHLLISQLEEIFDELKNL